MKYILILVVILLLGCQQVPQFKTFKKIDAHVHIESSDASFIKLVEENNFKLLTIAYDASNQDRIDEQVNNSVVLHNKYPKSVVYATTFSMEHFGEPDWQKNTIEFLQKSFNNGAIAVKVWKDIGMTFRNQDSSFIMMDDERLDTIWDFIESQNITLVNHTAEPKNCWLPLSKMTVKDDSGYYADNPQYHMYKHPEYPLYDEILAARNRMLDKHPNIRYVGCHFGSQEWSVDEQAKFFDKYPNASTDMASRIVHLKYQDNKKVRDFFIKYQDRLLYGTDVEIAAYGEKNVSQVVSDIINDVYMADWEYFTSDKSFTHNEKVKEYNGLNLPTDILEKIYYKNAIRMYPGIE